MAHRIYIYNIDSETHQTHSGYLGEWNYVIPDLLFPLLSANPKTKGKALYFDKVEGVNRLSLFYDLLTETYQLQDNKSFSDAVSLMFEFLFDLPYDTFYVDASDVYTMNEEKPKEQAKQWVEEIIEKWALYEGAIENQDLSQLDSIITASGYESFLDALQHDWVNFGLGYWEETVVKQSRSVVFNEGNLQGLKDKNGKILAPALYNVIYAFSEVYIAVVEQGGKYGYITDQGRLIVPPQYENAFDAYSVHDTKVGIVCVGEKTGLLNLDTQQWAIAPEYDEVEQLYDQYYNVLQNGQYQVVDYKGKNIVTEASVFPFDLDYPIKFFTKQEGTAKCKYYTLTGQFLGEFPEDVLEELPLDCYWIKPNKYQKKSSVINPKGQTILEDIDQMLVFSNYTSFAFKTNKQWKLFDCKTQTLRLTNQSINKIHAKYLCNYMPDVYVIQTNKGCGLYQAATDCWLIEPHEEHSKIEHLNCEYLLVFQKQGMRYYNSETHYLSEVYTYISQPLDHYTQRACLFKDTVMYYLDYEGHCLEIDKAQMGMLYEQRYNIRGTDLSFFTSFYEAWVTRMGAGYEECFDSDTLYHRGIAARDREEWEEVVRYFTIGATRKDPRMQYELGFILTDENQWTDIPKGIEYLESAAKLDYADAWNTIGYLYQNAIGYAYDFEAMIQAYEKAVELGCVWANQNLGDLYFYGQHVVQDYDKALSYYLLSEKYYGSYAQNLIEIYYQRSEFDQVLKYLKRNKYQPYIHIYYGILYDHGYGVKSSEKKAVAHYEQALAHSSYFYAVERLVYYYKEHPKFENAEDYQRILAYAEANEIEVK
ncbi:tetratricopeptide repeat protein [Myroides sp. WP-1]|uniref:SEL1-like repeat protein n=1 Tax=Myroides sp. WP-1 TaxID=2759944 RepID=UPI0015FC791C|nr:tetratricopeptide repeat protein [Myroides sp. WP-1]MBB1140121.1 SEL1-like repeat protein [Myroides sp. WP-1]